MLPPLRQHLRDALLRQPALGFVSCIAERGKSAREQRVYGAPDSGVTEHLAWFDDVLWRHRRTQTVYEMATIGHRPRAVVLRQVLDNHEALDMMHRLQAAVVAKADVV